jgi:SRSO17 transposase
MRSEFTALRIRPANRDIPRADDGTLPEQWLIAEWPNGKAEPTDFWISNLPADTPIATLVRLAKIRWRIEHDYRELKTGVGLDHFEGRSWIGWHHHATLATAAHVFLTWLRLTNPKANGQA